MNMLKEIMENGDGESGVVMIEAVYVVVIAVLIIPESVKLNCFAR